MAHHPAGTLHSRLMIMRGRIDPNEQLSIIYRAQFKDFSSNYTEQTSRIVATRIRHTAIRRAAPQQITRFETPECLNFLLGDS